MSGWEIAGLVVILVIVVAAFAMGIAALSLRASAQHRNAVHSSKLRQGASAAQPAGGCERV